MVQPATLKTYEATLNQCRNLVLVSQKLHQLGTDDSDEAFRSMRVAILNLENAIKNYEEWSKDDLEDGLSVPGGSPQSRSNQKKSFRGRFRCFKKLREHEPNPLKMAREKLEIAHDVLCDQMTALLRTTAKRSRLAQLGSFYTLAECRKLVAKDCDKGFDLRGRYEKTANQLFESVQKLRAVKAKIDEMKSRPNPKTDIERAPIILNALYTRLAHICDDIISFLLTVPFDVKGFDMAMMEMNRIVEAVIEGQNQPSTLFQSITIGHDDKDPFKDSNDDDEFDDDPFRYEETPKDSPTNNEPPNCPVVNKDPKSPAIKDIQRHKQLIERIQAIKAFLTDRKAKYNEKKIKLDNLPWPLPASERSLPKFSLNAGDLKNTTAVVECMSRRRDDPKGGSGVPKICSGNVVNPVKQNSGSYGIVSCMNLPKNTEGVDAAKMGHLVAVKILLDVDQTDESRAMANLRMLREANRWAAVSADPRKLAGGGEYLAEVLGIWDDFQDGRPGLVSLWGTCNLATFVRRGTLSITQRLDLAYKVAQGVQYLHTCKPHPIVYGDIKGANVVMVGGKPQLTDFGIAKCLDYMPGFTTRYESYADTCRAPEIQYHNLSLVRYPSRKSDVYAFGCLLFEVLSGKTPYEGFSRDTRSDWLYADMDYTPLHAEALKDNQTQYSFEEAHSSLMESCFDFHASRRPNMEKIVTELNILVKASQVHSKQK